MAFHSGSFLVFFLVVLFICRLDLANNTRKLVLLAASYYFYATYEVWFLALLVLTSGATFAWGRLFVLCKNEAREKQWVTGGIILNLCVLGYFKYSTFFLAGFGDLSRAFGIGVELPILQIILPIGISFFTFKNIAYIIDIHRRKVSVADSALDYLLYIGFFPQLVSGPIVRPKFFLDQLKIAPSLSSTQFQDGLQLVITGYIKKVFLADLIATQIVNPAFAEPEVFQSAFLLVALYGFTVQIYLDLSGYTDMARGFGKMLGYELPENFNRPYLAWSVGNFWQRWHMSMSSFFRDYLFIGLGGSRKGNVYINILLTFLAIGFWHQAGWNFLLYGLLHGSMVAFERYRRNKLLAAGLEVRPPSGLHLLVAVLFVFHFVTFSRVLFRGDSLGTATDYLMAMLAGSGTVFPVTWLGYCALAVGLLLNYLPPNLTEHFKKGFAPTSFPLQAACIVALIFLGVALTVEQPSFIYFEF